MKELLTLSYLASVKLSVDRREHSSAEPPGNVTFLEVQGSVA